VRFFKRTSRPLFCFLFQPHPWKSPLTTALNQSGYQTTLELSAGLMLKAHIPVRWPPFTHNAATPAKILTRILVQAATQSESFHEFEDQHTPSRYAIFPAISHFLTLCLAGIRPLVTPLQDCAFVFFASGIYTLHRFMQCSGAKIL
jgi:hypothetical protein